MSSHDYYLEDKNAKERREKILAFQNGRTFTKLQREMTSVVRWAHLDDGTGSFNVEKQSSEETKKGS
jgi:hypothetical protein